MPCAAANLADLTQLSSLDSSTSAGSPTTSSFVPE
jgi:hypothetical protein